MVAVRVFQERSKPVEMGLLTKTKLMCELVEGIVTIPHFAQLCGHWALEARSRSWRAPRTAAAPVVSRAFTLHRKNTSQDAAPHPWEAQGMRSGILTNFGGLDVLQGHQAAFKSGKLKTA